MPPSTHSSRDTVPLLSASIAVIMSFRTWWNQIWFHCTPFWYLWASDEENVFFFMCRCRWKCRWGGHISLHFESHRLQLWHIPVQILCSVHHLCNNPIYFLKRKKIHKKNEQSFSCSDSCHEIIIFTLHCKAFLKDSRSCRALHSRPCRTARKQLTRVGERK